MSRKRGFILLLLFGLLAWLGFAACTNDKPSAPARLSSQKGIGNPDHLLTTTYSPCLDGEIDHTTTDCDSCGSSFFSSNTTALTATVTGDEAQTGNCVKRKQMVIVFNTSDLGSAPSSATLHFTVKTIGPSLDVTTDIIRVYSKTGSTPCQTTLGPNDFIGCGSGYTNLGTLTISGTGAKSFTVPNPGTNISSNGITKFVLVDASEYSSGDGQQKFIIHTQEATTSSNRPTLDVN
jgi:hypothetical protein